MDSLLNPADLRNLIEIHYSDVGVLEYVSSSSTVPAGDEFVGEGRPCRPMSLLTVEFEGDKIRKLSKEKGVTKIDLIAEILTTVLLEQALRMNLSNEISRRKSAQEGLSAEDALLQLSQEFPAIDRGNLTMFARVSDSMVEVAPEYLLDSARTMMNLRLMEQNTSEALQQLEPINFKRLAKEGWHPAQPIVYRGIKENKKRGYTVIFGLDHGYFPHGAPQNVQQLMDPAGQQSPRVLAHKLGTMEK